MIEVPKTTSHSFNDKWTTTQLSKSSSSDIEGSTFAFVSNISSRVTSSSTRSIFEESTTESEREQFLTKIESSTTTKSPITPECHGILCQSSTVSPTRNDTDASITFFLRF